jgi:hypothetical protein
MTVPQDNIITNFRSFIEDVEEEERVGDIDRIEGTMKILDKAMEIINGLKVELPDETSEDKARTDAWFEQNYGYLGREI